jgi:hypothetical protein
MDVGQRASTAAGLSSPIQNMCQRDTLIKDKDFQCLGTFAVH